MLESGARVYSYVAIRADEEYREGYVSKNEALVVKLPFRDAGIDKAGVLELLEGSGLGLPRYYAWRTRSGGTGLRRSPGVIPLTAGCGIGTGTGWSASDRRPLAVDGERSNTVSIG